MTEQQSIVAQLGPYVAVASFLMNLLIAVVGATWGIAKIRAAVTAEMVKHKEAIDLKIAEQYTALNARIDSVAHSAGENFSALRTKINEVELWARDNFIRRESFLAVVNEWRDGFKEMGGRMDRRLERIESLLLGRPAILPPKD